MFRLHLSSVLFLMIVAGAFVTPLLAHDDYDTRDVQGWTVYVHHQLLQQEPEQVERGLEILDEQIRRLIAVVPAEKVERLKLVPMWISPPYEGFGPTAEYHPSADWLRENGRAESLAKCIEFTNLAIMERENKRMPMFVLHELAHAYHDQVVGFENGEVIKVFEQARKSRSYDNVERHDGKMAKSYAMTNHKEYFAEDTEAFFGRNDFYPFTASQLKEHDPAMFALLEKIWGSPQR
ncbi:MAG: metallopeptidase [Planctomycetaceae bacterium]|nr:metallopeptidase [Planctomycetaceae bacterium]MCB9950784.1 metallopeptidase [Planctomycetaceae bacterium]